MSYSFYLCSGLNLYNIFSLITSIAAVFVSVVAGFIGLIALSVSVWQGILTRKNYRLSVRPYISIIGNWSLFSDYFGIILENKGIGPAIIQSIIIHYSGKNYNYLSDPSGFLSDLMKETSQMKEAYIEMHKFDDGKYIQPGERLPIVFIRKPESETAIKFKEILAEASVSVDYKSIYDESFNSIYELIS